MAWCAGEAIHAESTLAAAGDLPSTTDAASDPTAAHAAQWADRNIPVMITALAAAVDRREHPAVALRLAGALWPLLRARGCHDEQLTIARLGVQAARAHRDRAAEARMTARTGHALAQLGQPGKAVAHLCHAAGLWEQIGDHTQLTATHRAWGQALMALHRPADATACLAAALAAYERAARQRDIAVTLIDLGEALTAAGRPTEAATRLRQARRLLSAEPDPYRQARAQAALGTALAHHPRLAAVHLQRALQTMSTLGCLPGQATLLQTLGDLAAQEGQPARARHYYTEALAMLPATHPAGQLLRDSLATLDEPQPDHYTCYDQED